MQILKTTLLISSLMVAGSVVAAAAASAESLPAVKTSGGNKVPECATPGRMMAFIASRNPNLDGKYDGVATAYMRHGEEIGLRWDYAFFQMMMETANLAYKRGNGRPGDVRPSQNNFAGLGASGNGEHGESFKDVDSGVKAHLQHLQMYSGEHVDDPVAERTRKVQEWGVLTSWQRSIKHPITFEDLARQWAPGSNGYSRDIEAIASRFYGEFCEKPDPHPEMLQEARAGAGSTQVAVAESKRSTKTKVAERSDDEASESRSNRPSGKQLARAAMERARAEPDAASERAALGAPVDQSTSKVRIINETEPSASAGPPDSVKTASAGVGASTAATAAGSKPTSHAASKCRVWTASYGGQKSVIIRSNSDQLTNFTVLDVNDGQEGRETDAYIAAYAKGGQKIAEFPNQTSAMEKAFQLCPEG